MIKPIFLMLQVFKLEIWLSVIPFYQDFFLGTRHSFGTWLIHYPESVIVMPYGIFWQSFYLLFSSSGYRMLGVYLWLFDCLMTFVIVRFQSAIYAMTFSLTSALFFLFSPGDLLPFWMATIGKEKPFMSIIAIVTKLPWPAPFWVWNFVLNTSLPENTGSYLIWRYIVLGVWIIHPLFYWLKNHIYDEEKRGLKNGPIRS